MIWARRPAPHHSSWSFTLNSKRRLGEHVRLENAASIDPVLGDVADYNLDVTSKLSTRITRRLALTVAHAYSFDSTPAPDVAHADQRFQAGLTIEL